MKSIFKSFFNWWDQFWFAPKDLIGLSCMRVVLYGTFFYMYLFRSLNLSLFNESGMVPRDRALEIMPDFYRGFFAWFSLWPDSSVAVVHLIYLVLLFCLLLGVFPRFLGIFAWIIHVGFIQRNYSAIFGADYIGGIFILYLSFTKSDQYFSVLAFFKRKKISYQRKINPSNKNFLTEDLLSSVFYRIIQIHIAVIYAYTGLEKLKGSSWWDGTAIWTVLANSQIAIADFTFVRSLPLVVWVLTTMTVVFEIYFPAAILSRKLREPWLLLGVFFHIGIGLTLGLFSFSLIMMSTYFVLLQPERIRAALDFLPKIFGKGVSKRDF